MQSLWGEQEFKEENINNEPFRQRIPGDPITKWDVFCYVHGILHHPEYRKRYAENLKHDLPHIPFCQRTEEFWCTVHVGEALIELQTGYEAAPMYPLKQQINPTLPLSFRVQQMKLSPDRTALIFNESMTLAGIPPEVFEYQLGNRSALEWVIDQYQITTDQRSGIVSDPNNADDPGYIYRLVCQVIMVSLHTLELVKILAENVNADGWYGEVQPFKTGVNV